MKLTGCLALALALAACGGKSKDSTTTPTAATAPSPVLAISDLKFYEGDKMGLHLHPDGRLEMLVNDNGAESWRDVAAIKADGTIAAGNKVVHVTADGTILDPDGKPVVDAKLDGAALVAGGKRATIDDKGMLLVDGAAANGAPIRVDGAHDDSSRRTALVIVAMMVGVAQRSPAPAPEHHNP